MSLSNLTISNTLPVGQSFLWHRRTVGEEAVEEFSRAVDNPPRVVCLRQTPTDLYYTAIHPTVDATEEDFRLGWTRRWLEDYFHLDKHPDLPALYANWRQSDPGLFGRVEIDQRAVGVRLLRQDPWECLLRWVILSGRGAYSSFITSTNNHIPRISSLMHKLAIHFSPVLLTLDDTPYHLLPGPEQLPIKLESILRELGFGYRAGFIESSLATLRERFGDSPSEIQKGLESWRLEDVDLVRENLIGLKGVGRKVADCVMLMCLDKVRYRLHIFR